MTSSTLRRRPEFASLREGKPLAPPVGGCKQSSGTILPYSLLKLALDTNVGDEGKMVFFVVAAVVTLVASDLLSGAPRRL